MPVDLADSVMGYLIILFRVAAVVGLMPALGEASIPMRVKLAISLGLAMITFPAVQSFIPSIPVGSARVLQLIATEIVIGLILGLLLRVFLFILQIAGSIAAQSTSLSQILGTAGVDPLPALGHVVTLSGLALAMLMGLHVAAASYLISSYIWLPPGVMPRPGDIAELMVGQVASGFRLAFALAAPFYMLALLYNLTLGVINRAMPQLMVAFVGAPVITAGALALLAVSAPIMILVWKDILFSFMSAPGIW